MKSLYDLPVKSLGHNEDYQSRLEDLRYRAKFPNLSNYMIGVNDLVVRFIFDSDLLSKLIDLHVTNTKNA